MNLGIIIILFIILSFLCVYLLAYTNQTNEILNKINPRDDRSFLGGIDIVELIKAYRKNEKLSEKEQKLFKTVFILSTISIVLFAVIVFFVFGTNW